MSSALLGLHRGPDIALAAVASLTAVQPDQARAPLAELVREHLLTEYVPGRYTFHDLLRAYVTEQACAHDSQDVRDAAVHRVLDHYPHTAHSAAMPIVSRHWPPSGSWESATGRPLPGIASATFMVG